MATITVTPGHTYGPTDTVTSTNLNDLGSPTAALTAGTILTADIADANVTFAKLTDVNDDDTMSNASATTLATSESIKAYVDEYSLKYSGATGTINGVGVYVYADLDLSATVGSNRALVILEVEGGSTASSIFFRTKGSTVKPYGSNSSGGWGASGGVISGANDGSVITVITDSNGVIEYTAGTTTGISYTVQAYQKLA
jgi:hypothetical protein